MKQHGEIGTIEVFAKEGKVYLQYEEPMLGMGFSVEECEELIETLYECLDEAIEQNTYHPPLARRTRQRRTKP